LLNFERQRWLDRVLGPPLCWLVKLLHGLRGPETMPRHAPDPGHRLSEMGAPVLTRPMFDRLQKNHPSATFYVLCSEHNRPALDLLDVVPTERVSTVRSESLRAFARDSIGAVRRMRALQLDAVLDLELFARASAILAGLSGARIRVGFHRFTQEGLYRGDLTNRPVLPNPYQHVAHQFVTLGEVIGSTDADGQAP
jgi:ADP-heptose:LPS heptosyltransferase